MKFNHHSRHCSPIIRRGLALFLLLLTSCVLSLSPVLAERAEQSTITIKQTVTVDRVGNAKIDAVWNFNPPRIYDRMKQNYPNLYLLLRDYGNDRADFEIDRSTLKITADDQKRSITFQARVLGFAVCRKDRWEFKLSAGEDIVTQDANKVFTTEINNAQVDQIISSTNAYILPTTVQNVALNSSKHQLTYNIPYEKGKTLGPSKIDANLRFKEQIMSALYKIYADPQVGGGSYWVGKTILTNTGKDPIFDLKIYYKLGDYTSLTVPEKYSMVMPGGTVVDLFYPIISSQVAQLKTKTPVQLYMKYEYKDSDGKLHTEESTERVDILGINQFLWSNLSNDELTDSWFDYFNNATLISAFVTRMDDSVKQFAGFVSEASGGVAAASNDDDAKLWLKTAYNLEIYNNIVYQTPSSFMAVGQGLVQELKYPRDVFRDKAGTCVDLAITYAAIAEATGLHSYIILLPGHAFAIIELPSGDWVPVENTGLGGGNNRLTFEQAVEIATKELKEAFQKGVYYIVDVKAELSSGRIPNPELPAVSADFLAQCGIKRFSKDTTSTTNNDNNSSNSNNNGAQTQNDTSGNNKEGVVFLDDFTNPNSGWSNKDNTENSWGYTKGVYEGRAKKKNFWYGTFAPLSVPLPPVYIVQADMALANGRDGSYGILFNCGDNSNVFYVFMINPSSRSFALWKSVEDGWEYPIKWTSSNYIKSGSSTNTVAVIQGGNRIILAINGQALNSDVITIDEASGTKKVGLCILSGNDLPTDVLYDNFQVTEFKK